MSKVFHCRDGRIPRYLVAGTEMVSKFSYTNPLDYKASMGDIVVYRLRRRVKNIICPVCKELIHTKPGSITKYVATEYLVKISRDEYVALHPGCKDMYLTNPLPYE